MNPIRSFMARKNTLQYQLSSAQSMAANFISPVTLVKYLDNCSYQINVTASGSSGTFSVQASNDYQINEANGSTVTNSGTWVDLTLNGGVPTIASANDTIIIDLNQLPFNAIRIAYTSSVAGAGHCDIWMSSKQIGG